MNPEGPSFVDDDNEIHLWKIDLDDPGWDAFAGTLSVDELARAARFHGAALQEEFRRCRGALRRILADYSRWRPETIRFHYGEFGKPELDGAGLHFNLSHSRRLAIVGISTHRIGVDIEYRRELSDLGGLVKMICNVAERNALYELPPAEQQDPFYRIWVRKEAFCKAIGTGLRSDLKALDIDSQGRVTYRGASHPGLSCDGMYVHDLEIADGYSAALCTAAASPRIIVFPARPNC